MTKDSEYKLRKRIKELEEELFKAKSDFGDYRYSMMEIFDGINSVTGDSIEKNWINKRFRRLFK